VVPLARDFFRLASGKLWSFTGYCNQIHYPWNHIPPHAGVRHWLGLSGKPYNGILFNVHKLIALGAVIVTGMQVYKALQGVEIQARLIALIVVTGLCVVALFVTGVDGRGKPAYNVLRTIHTFTPFLAVITLAVTVYLLTGRTYEIQKCGRNQKGRPGSLAGC
jgi:hypothetical protein